jgi:osmotically-inducible protein OsmY/sporulation protein YlmC with PRC-barrel domain
MTRTGTALREGTEPGRPVDAPAVDAPAPDPLHPVPLRIGAAVHALDGPAGRLERVVISPRSRRVTHLIVRTGWPLPALGRAVVAPVSLLHGAGAAGAPVALFATRRELEALPGFVESAYVAPDPAWQPPAGYARDHVLHRLARGEDVAETELLDTGLLVHRRKIGLPDELVTLRRGQPVVCLGGAAGHVERVLMDLATGAVTHFVLRRGGVGPFFGRSVVVPVDWARWIDDDAVLLDVGQEQLDSLPEYRGHPDDRALEAAVRQALAQDARTQAVAARVGVVAHDGVVDLTGSVASEETRAAAAAVASRAPGVREVRNALTADTRLRAAVQEALAEDPRTAGDTIDVAVTGGVVYLDGQVSDAEARAAAETIARSVPGVTLVVNGLYVEPTP